MTDRYGRLTVISRACDYVSPSGYKKKQLNCKCDCGKVVIVHQASLRRGLTKSCGCLRDEKAATIKFKHGLSGHYLYNTYRSMITRCYDPKSVSYKYYGDRGITVCDEWLNSFEQFLIDIGERPSDEHSIDRVNGDIGYNKENCKWATILEQNQNRTYGRN